MLPTQLEKQIIPAVNYLCPRLKSIGSRERYVLFFQAEERLAMVEEQRKIEEQRQRLRKEQEKRVKEEQKVILGKNNSRPKLSFSLKPAVS